MPAAAIAVCPEPESQGWTDPTKWSESAGAADLLTDMVRRPPVRELSAIYYGRVREDRRRYVGDRVSELHRLRREAVTAAAGVDPDASLSAVEIRRWLEANEAAPPVNTVIDAVLVVAGASILERDVRR